MATTVGKVRAKKESTYSGAADSANNLPPLGGSCCACTQGPPGPPGPPGEDGEPGNCKA